MVMWKGKRRKTSRDAFFNHPVLGHLKGWSYLIQARGRVLRKNSYWAQDGLKLGRCKESRSILSAGNAGGGGGDIAAIVPFHWMLLQTSAYKRKGAEMNPSALTIRLVGNRRGIRLRRSCFQVWMDCLEKLGFCKQAKVDAGVYL
ncbi:hypothetical protein CEXT_439841 [Caerostris extrusa]|uniref:Uncharacterized protein n=1 Tax=Caerostris extrusa TaxID=172846 RepID=A0AAV4Y2C0_CAEEX|nr:hypothetical protein CEXT_439841 [Caerostris extrusa]